MNAKKLPGLHFQAGTGILSLAAADCHLCSKVGTKKLAKIKESPLFLVKGPAGLPSPAADYVESGLDLNDYLVKHRAATFIFDVCGNSMCGVGIFDGNKIVVDKSLEARHGMIIAAILNGEHPIKRLRITQDSVELRPENLCYPPFALKSMKNSSSLAGGRRREKAAG